MSLIFLDSTCEFIKHLSFSLWLISFSKMPSRSIRVVTNGGFPSFIWINNIPFYKIYLIFFIHSSVNGHLGYFHVLTVVKNAIVNTEVQIYLWDSDFISFQYIPISRIAESYYSRIFNFLRTLYTFPTVAIPIYIPTNSAPDFLFYTSLSAFVIFCLFENNHANRCEIVSRCGFDLHIPDG